MLKLKTPADRVDTGRSMNIENEAATGRSGGLPIAEEQDEQYEQEALDQDATKENEDSQNLLMSQDMTQDGTQSDGDPIAEDDDEGNDEKEENTPEDAITKNISNLQIEKRTMPSQEEQLEEQIVPSQEEIEEDLVRQPVSTCLMLRLPPLPSFLC